MAFMITPLTPSEIPSYISIQYNAFASSSSSVSPIFYPRGLTPPIRSFMHNLTLQTLQDPSTHMLLIRDSRSIVVGIAKWILYPTTKSEAELLNEESVDRAARASQPPIDGLNAPAVNLFREAQALAHRVHMQGLPHVYLAILATATEHQRRGVGRVGLEWGLREADRLGLPVYLEGTRDGLGLYESVGFVVVGPLGFEAGVGRDLWCMVREPRTWDGRGDVGGQGYSFGSG